MVETAAHLADHVIPRLPVRQWVLSAPKRLRYHLQHDPTVLNSDLATASETGAWAPFVGQARHGVMRIRPAGATCAGL